MHPSPAQIARRRAVQRAKIWRRTKPFLYIPALLLNPAFVLGYLIGKQSFWILKILADLIVIAAILACLWALSASPKGDLPSEWIARMIAAGIIFLAGTAGGEIRTRWNSAVEIYYLSTTNGQLSSISLFVSTTYLHCSLFFAY